LKDEFELLPIVQGPRCLFRLKIKRAFQWCHLIALQWARGAKCLCLLALQWPQEAKEGLAYDFKMHVNLYVSAHLYV
jgi:hypothetical protein